MLVEVEGNVHPMIYVERISYFMRFYILINDSQITWMGTDVELDSNYSLAFLFQDSCRVY